MPSNGFELCSIGLNWVGAALVIKSHVMLRKLPNEVVTILYEQDCKDNKMWETLHFAHVALHHPQPMSTCLGLTIAEGFPALCKRYKSGTSAGR